MPRPYLLRRSRCRSTPNLPGSRRRPAPNSSLAPGAARAPTSLDPGITPPPPPTSHSSGRPCRLCTPPSSSKRGSAPRPTPPATRAPAPNCWLVGFPGRRWLVLPLATASSPAIHLRHLLKEKRWFFTVLLVYSNDVTRFSCLCVCTNDNSAVFACLCGHGCSQ